MGGTEDAAGGRYRASGTNMCSSCMPAQGLALLYIACLDGHQSREAGRIFFPQFCRGGNGGWVAVILPGHPKGTCRNYLGSP